MNNLSDFYNKIDKYNKNGYGSNTQKLVLRMNYMLKIH